MNNAFVNAAVDTATTTLTENGDKTFSTSLNAVVDLFFQAGAMRAQSASRVETVFSAAYKENPDLAVRTALWARDVREGAGERKVFRTILKWLGKYQPAHVERILAKIPALGRWDDVLELLDKNVNPNLQVTALDFYAQALMSGDGLAAKWAPREKADRLVAARLRGVIGFGAKEYRKLIAGLSKTVEQQMCAKDWTGIVYDHVPSVASARYAKAFGRHDNTRYVQYLEAVRGGKVSEVTGKVAKINTGAVYPYDVIKHGVTDLTADTMWQNLPDFVPEGLSFMPIVDVSGSMMTSVGGSTSAYDVALSLGMYLSERNKSAFKDLFITFSTNPQFQRITGATIRDRYNSMDSNNWAMSTDLDKAMNLILDTAVTNRVPQADMPSTLLILSDMEFNGGYGSKTSVAERTETAFRNAGYKLPNIVWWNIVSRHGSTPVRSDESGMALVSGFSPSIMMSLLGGEMTPEKIMLKTIMKDRYTH